VVADINVKNIDISHSDISKLKISAISPTGKEIVLVSERCAGISGMLTSFDDASPLELSCGQIKANRTFKPQNPLDEFNGEQVQGNWSVRITTLRGGSSGKVNNIDFDYVQA
jgi:subtilisin-like proprotein convertase family protein